MNIEVKRKQGNGFVSFNMYTHRYFFENLDDKEIKKIYKNGFDLPLRIQWRITKLCNLNCKHCYLNNKNIDKEELSKKELIRIANKIIKNKIFEVLITGGEPTVKEGIDRVLEILCKKCVVTVFTNAYDKKELTKLISLFKKYKRNLRINVSLDGNKQIHDFIRGKGTFDKTIENIKDLVENGIEVIINTVLTKQFIPYLEEYINFIKKINVKSIQFSKFYPLGEGKNFAESMPTSEEFKKVTIKLMKISKEINKPNIIFDHTFCFLLGEKRLKVDHRKCSGGFSKMIIESNGDVYPCQLLPLSKFKIGNILKDDIKKIWDSKNRKKFVIDFFPDECKKCSESEYCSCGCKASSYSIHKIFKYKDPYCFNEK